MRRRRLIQVIDTGSFADIAFLLIIFFMVVASFQKSYKIEMNLPPKSNNTKSGNINPSKVLNVYLNTTNEVLVEENYYKHYSLVNLDREFQRITKSPGKALIKINMSAHTDYQVYLNILAKIKESKSRSIDSLSRTLYNSTFNYLSDIQKSEVSSRVSYSITENEK